MSVCEGLMKKCRLVGMRQVGEQMKRDAIRRHDKQRREEGKSENFFDSIPMHLLVSVGFQICLQVALLFARTRSRRGPSAVFGPAANPHF